RIKEDDRKMFDFFGLDEREGFKQFVHRPKATREDDKGMGIFDKHSLAYKEVAKVKRDIEVWIRRLIKRQLNVTANRTIPTLLCLSILCLHNAGPTTCNNTKPGFRQRARSLPCCTI